MSGHPARRLMSRYDASESQRTKGDDPEPTRTEFIRVGSMKGKKPIQRRMLPSRRPLPFAGGDTCAW